MLVSLKLIVSMTVMILKMMSEVNLKHHRTCARNSIDWGCHGLTR